MKSIICEKFIKSYVKKRDDAVVSAVKDHNFDKLKTLLRTIGKPVPADIVLEAVAYKMCCNITTMPVELQQQSEAWLTEHGMSTSIY